MKIRNVKVIVTCPGRNYVVVKIETDEPGFVPMKNQEGRVGWIDIRDRIGYHTFLRVLLDGSAN